jgi:tripartite-type tricarboxylate transporter receptor subunit TctC
MLAAAGEDAAMLARRTLLKFAAAVPAFAPLISKRAFAQAYPSRPVRIIVTTGPGGQGDITARLLAAKLTEALGQSFYVENIGGGGGNIAMGTAARAAPDGYTILGATSNLVTNVGLYAKLPYDPDKDFAPISLLCSSPHLLAVHPSVPANNVRELIALIKASPPGKFSFASAGRGTPAHLAGELFKLTFGLDVTHVPFNGGGPASAAVVAGHVQLAVPALPTSSTYVRGGQLRGLALFSSKRASAMPDIQTMQEATGEDLPADIINGFVVPAGTPQPIVDTLYREVIKVMALPEVKDKLAGMGFDPVASTPEEFRNWMKRELGRWTQVIRDAKIAAQ